MNEIILNAIPFEPDAQALLSEMRIQEDSDHAGEFLQLLAAARRIARPKAVYRMAYVDGRGEDSVWIEGVRLDSRVLAVNLREVERIFPYIATCGVELEGWAQTLDDMLARFWADAILETALYTAIETLKRHLEACYHPGQLAYMNPGSLEDWPISQQRELFSLFSPPEASIGVRLTPSHMMVPIKSVSGIRFPTQTSFESCMLCPRQACPNRRTAYDPLLYAARYG